jgi:hypothetical protein
MGKRKEKRKRKGERKRGMERGRKKELKKGWLRNSGNSNRLIDHLISRHDALFKWR